MEVKGGGEGGRAALDGVTRDGDGVDGVVGELGVGRDGEGVARNADFGVDLDGALFKGDGGVFAPALIFWLKVRVIVYGERGVYSIVSGVDRS